MSPGTGAVIIGMAVGIPGVTYLLALHNLVASKTPAAIAVVAVLVFVTINFAPVIVPSAFIRAHPRRTERAIKRVQHWIASHERQIAAAVALFVGAYMVISGTLRLVADLPAAAVWRLWCRGLAIRHPRRPRATTAAVGGLYSPARWAEPSS